MCFQNIRCVGVLYEYYFRQVAVVLVERVLGESVVSDIAENYFHAAFEWQIRTENCATKSKNNRKIGEKKTITTSFTVQNVF